MIDGMLVASVITIIFFGAQVLERWMEHRETMAGKREVPSAIAPISLLDPAIVQTAVKELPDTKAEALHETATPGDACRSRANGGTATNDEACTAILNFVGQGAINGLISKLVMGNLVRRDWKPILSKAGDTVNVPRPQRLTSHDLTEKGTIDREDEPSSGNAQIVLNTHAEVTFTIPDMQRVLSSPALLDVYLEAPLVALTERIESDLFKLHSRLQRNKPLGSPGVPITDATTLDDIERVLFESKVPLALPRFLVVGPFVYSRLRQVTRFTEFMRSAGTGLNAAIAGPIGKLGNLFILRSNEVAKFEGKKHNLAFAADAFVLVTRKLPLPIPGHGVLANIFTVKDFGIRVIMGYDPRTLTQQFTIDILYGVGVLRDDFAVEVIT